MIEMVFDLYNSGQQPYFQLMDFFEINVLVDTGSELPMWIKDEETLISLGGKKCDNTVSLLGTSGEHKCCMYRIDVKFGQILYKDMPIIFNPIKSEKLVNIQMIFGASNFRGMIYTIDTINNKLIVKCPENQLVYNVKTLDKAGEIDILSNYIDT